MNEEGCKFFSIQEEYQKRGTLEGIRDNPVFELLSEEFKIKWTTKDMLAEAINAFCEDWKVRLMTDEGLKRYFCKKNKINKPDFNFKEKTEYLYDYFSKINGNEKELTKYWNYLHPSTEEDQKKSTP